MTAYLKKYIKPLAGELLNSYSILLFSGSKPLGFLLLVVSFFKPFAGLSAMAAGVLAVVIITVSGLTPSPVHKGLYSYNAVLLGMGMGSLYASSMAYWIILVLLVILSVVLSGTLAHHFLPKGLPFLTLPFVICLWLLMLVAREFTAVDLSARNIYWLNEMYAYGDKGLVDFVQYFEQLPWPPLILTFFRSLSCLFFQENILAGIIIFLALLWHSRIALSLVILGFITGYLFNTVVHAYEPGANYYLLNGNFMVGSMAIGSFFMLPSLYSYAWAILSVPITFIMMVALGKLTALLHLPVSSLPFCAATILLVHFVQLLRPGGRLMLTPLQLYSPERNLYNYLNASKRLFSEHYLRLQLPFMGQWIVSQGYDGDITHKGDWSKALDFVIVDAHMKTYTAYATQPENFYCFDKPVLAPADGYVQELIDHIDDNQIGKINRQANWGNTIVLKHAEGLYTKMCHLRKNSFKVSLGEYVKQGQVLATCGNSGRSPEPHLHFQVQGTPYVGSKTMAYPFQSFMVAKDGKQELKEFAVPMETNRVGPVLTNESLVAAFTFLPGYRMEVKAEGQLDQLWEVFTDAYNLTYFYCYQTGATAYFNHNATFFYFTAFYGDHNSLLYLFYRCCYKIGFSTELQDPVQDEFPLQWAHNTPSKWIQDLIAPFYIFRRLTYTSQSRVTGGSVFDPVVEIEIRSSLSYLHVEWMTQHALLKIEHKKISGFSFTQQHKKIVVTCSTNG